MVTNDIFVSFLHCNRKAFLRAAGIPGHQTGIETVLLDLTSVYRRKALRVFLDSGQREGGRVPRSRVTERANNVE